MLNRRRKSCIKTISYALATAALMTIVSGCTEDKIIEEQQTAQIEAGAIKKLRVSNPSGDLTIVGSDQVDKIEAVAKIKRTENVPSEAFKMTFTERGEEAEFVNSLSSSSFGIHVLHQMDITLSVPRKMELDIVDESGDIAVSGITGPVLIADQSGEMELKDIEGAVKITDESGNIKLEEVKGDLEILDDSGNVILTNNQGNVNMKDSSGEIEISNHSGMIVVVDDSGNVKIDQVKGNVTVEDESGDLRIEQIEGDVRIESDSSGNATIERVSGTVHNNSNK
ncbi:DUF4097 family beta strand repeat-containing protein [Paenibacillus arenosi]|uniref:DUF4097 family beta strand repeat protein n=1 Tax=Paenibacillus arenosi TaxID=2774142 RepID=A0ABR9AXH4_9BACL|nr:DUF4097 family beta strand repeat-containing protein [Paenibacillus arenosi]MBD8498398.1 DUF4097 family beta strand repeat protein [Paenibacillus arenosi]